MDLDPGRIARAAAEIDPVFLGTPQYVDVQLSARLGTRVPVPRASPHWRTSRPTRSPRS